MPQKPDGTGFDPLPISREPDPDAVDPQRSRPTGRQGDHQHLTWPRDQPADVPWKAGCSGMGTSGLEGGCEETISRKADMAPRSRPYGGKAVRMAKAGSRTAATEAVREVGRELARTA